MSAPAPTADRVASLRAFNRFYTRRIGVLHERLLDSRFTLPECRVLWELAHQPGLSAGALAQELGLDAGYLSRLVGSLRERGFVDGRVLALRSDRDRLAQPEQPAQHGDPEDAVVHHEAHRPRAGAHQQDGVDEAHVVAHQHGRSLGRDVQIGRAHV